LKRGAPTKKPYFIGTKENLLKRRQFAGGCYESEGVRHANGVE
jgi:hypothetical protein